MGCAPGIAGQMHDTAMSKEAGSLSHLADEVEVAEERRSCKRRSAPA